MGDRIHVVTWYRDLDWKALLEDNKTYVLHNCLVFDNDAAFKYVDHPFKVVLGPGSKVTRNDKLRDIPSHEFRFKSFKKIENGNFKPDVLYEIIGFIHEIVKTSVFGYGKKPCTNLVLRDEVGNLVDATLWDKYSLDLMKFLAERNDAGPVVLILTYAQCKLAG
ncbi:putative nucleic acid-binding protein [Medicago truncatula]|uniref:Putative nucleic acid-binding protein n=1 Tax=Medicago truncatula TaxID=3880 RepID=A0A396JKQ5_MEDTR|nr:putative nucleic acid-binding protein [Medicago truncatula]